VLRETTSRGLCGLVCPSRTSERGTRDKPSTLTHGGALLSLVPLVWESNPKLLGGWCKPNHQPLCVFITAVPITKLFARGGGGGWRTCATRDYEPRPV
jgi:hypothetical protein